MGEQPERHRRSHDLPQMRIGHAEREQVAAVLQQAAGEGRLEIDELEERLEATWAAKTAADLLPITADLVAPSAVQAPRGGSPASGHASSTAIMGDCRRLGVWRIPEQHTAFSLMGSVLLDLREAELSGPETLISASAVMGDVKVIVPAHVRVVIDGTPIMGDYGQAKDKVAADLGPGSPTIRLRGLALMGSVQVQRQPSPGTPKKFLGTY